MRVTVATISSRVIPSDSPFLMSWCANVSRNTSLSSSAELEVIELQELIHQFLTHRSTRPLLLAVVVMPHYSIDKKVPWSSIEVIAFIEANFVIR